MSLVSAAGKADDQGTVRLEHIYKSDMNSNGITRIFMLKQYSDCLSLSPVKKCASASAAFVIYICNIC